MIILESSLKGSPQRSLFFREQLTLQQFRHHSQSGLLTSQGQKKSMFQHGTCPLAVLRFTGAAPFCAAPFCGAPMAAAAERCFA
jgi:hypothetical protein